MSLHVFFSLVLFGTSFVPVFAMPTPIAREVTRHFVNEGTFEGGTFTTANLANIRMGSHTKEGYERWVVDFEDPSTKTIGQTAPRFSVRYTREQIGMAPTGEETVLAPARLLLSLRNIKESRVAASQLQRLAAKSGFVKEVILHPAIESGDRVVEWVLKGPSFFEAHQPSRREGRLVLDLRAPPGE